jgi:chemotaxis protein MotB
MNQEVEDPDKDVPMRMDSPESSDFDIKLEKRKLEQELQQEIMKGQVDVKVEGEKLVIQLKGDGMTGADQIESDQVKRAGLYTPERLGLMAKVSRAQQTVKAQTEVRVELEGEQAAETELATSAPKAPVKLDAQQTQQVAQMLETLKSQLVSGKVSIERRDDLVALVISEEDIFDSGSAVISKAAVNALKEVRDVILSSSGTVVIAGHTDNVPITGSGLFATNWDLSSSRAAAVAHAMTELLEVPAERLEVEAHADTRPIADNATEEGRRKNRRVEILMRPAA